LFDSMITVAIPMSLIRSPLLVRLVRLAPVLSSTATLALALAEYHYLLPWLALPDQSLSVNGHLPSWFNRWFRPSLAGTLILSVASTVGAKNAAASLYNFGGDFVRARLLYTCGACLTIAHFAFSSPFRKCLRRLVHGAASDARRELLRWLELHTIRTLTTDLPAWLCFIGAFMYTV